MKGEGGEGEGEGAGERERGGETDRQTDRDREERNIDRHSNGDAERAGDGPGCSRAPPTAPSPTPFPSPDFKGRRFRGLRRRRRGGVQPSLQPPPLVAGRRWHLHAVHGGLEPVPRLRLRTRPINNKIYNK